MGMDTIYELLKRFSKIEDGVIRELKERGKAKATIYDTIAGFYTYCGFSCLLEKAIKRKYNIEVECTWMHFAFENKLLLFFKLKQPKHKR